MIMNFIVAIPLRVSAYHALLGYMSILIGKMSKDSVKSNDIARLFLPLHKCCKTPMQTDSISQARRRGRTGGSRRPSCLSVGEAEGAKVPFFNAIIF